VVNDRILFENTLYHNNGNGTFTDVSAASGTNIAIDAMNAGVADYDHNGYLDIYITNSGPVEAGSSYLFANQGNGTFLNMAALSGTTFDRNGWGGNFFDYDHDLDLDLYVSSADATYETPNAFYINQGNNTFTEPLLTTGGLAGIDTARSLTNVIGDFNNDGRCDIAVCNDNIFPFYLWQNNTITTNHWFKLFLIGTHANRDAIGSWIEMWIDGEKYIRSLQSQEAYCGQNSKRLIMSTGLHTAIDSLIIKWPIKVGNTPFHKQVIPGSQIVMSAVNTIVEPTICHTVTSPLDNGLGSLRAAVECAQSGDTILLMLNPGDTIELSGAPIQINKTLVITSATTTKQPIRMQSGYSVFAVQTGRTLTLSMIYAEGTTTLVVNHGNLFLHSVELMCTANPVIPVIANFGTVEMFGNNEFRS
jgi:hypothetical protein